MKRNQSIDKYLNKFGIISKCLGCRVVVLHGGSPDDKKSKIQHKACYDQGKSIIIFLDNIKNKQELIEASVHELMHHAQFLRGLFKKSFKNRNNGSQVRVETHARKWTDRILNKIFGFHGSKMNNFLKKEYSK